jgi:hypothetical protein
MGGRRPRGEGGEEQKGTRVRDEKMHGGTAHEKGNASGNSLILMMDDQWPWGGLAASLLFIYREAIVEGKGKHRGENENVEGPEQSVASCACARVRVARHAYGRRIRHRHSLSTFLGSRRLKIC